MIRSFTLILAVVVIAALVFTTTVNAQRCTGGTGRFMEVASGMGSMAENMFGVKEVCDAQLDKNGCNVCRNYVGGNGQAICVKFSCELVAGIDSRRQDGKTCSCHITKESLDICNGPTSAENLKSKFKILKAAGTRDASGHVNHGSILARDIVYCNKEIKRNCFIAVNQPKPKSLVESSSETKPSAAPASSSSSAGSKKSHVDIPNHCITTKSGKKHCGTFRVSHDHPLARTKGKSSAYRRGQKGQLKDANNRHHAKNGKFQKETATNSAGKKFDRRTGQLKKSSTKTKKPANAAASGPKAKYAALAKKERALAKAAKKAGNGATAHDHEQKAKKYEQLAK